CPFGHSPVFAKPMLSGCIWYGWDLLLIDGNAWQYAMHSKNMWFNDPVKRNRSRYSNGFIFQRAADLKEEVVAICDHIGLLQLQDRSSNSFTRLKSSPCSPRPMRPPSTASMPAPSKWK